jgi:hypothetical protein
MAAAGQLLIAEKFAPSSLAAVLEAAYGVGPGRSARGRQPVAIVQSA